MHQKSSYRSDESCTHSMADCRRKQYDLLCCLQLQRRRQPQQDHNCQSSVENEQGESPVSQGKSDNLSDN